MIRIDELIERLCPNGVKYKALGEIGNFYRGSSFQKKNFVESGTPCIHYGQIHTRFNISTDCAISYLDEGFAARMKRASHGDLIIATTSEDDDAVGKAIAWLGDEDVVVSNDAYIYHHDQNPKYISYLFDSNLFQGPKRPFITGTKVRRISDRGMSQIRVPVPPMEVQQEVVHVLDSFVELEAELEAELETRHRQYDYYRDRLFADCDSIEWVSLLDLAKDCDRARKPIKQEDRIPGDTPYYGASGIVDHVDGFTHEGDYLLVSEDGANLVARTYPIAFQIHGRNWVNNHAHVLQINNGQQRKLVEIYLNSISLEPYISKGAQPKLTKKKLGDIKVPVPSEADLARIVGILEQFDALTTDISQGLPAEIEARRKQYAYYRDKLLTFKEKVA